MNGNMVSWSRGPGASRRCSVVCRGGQIRTKSSAQASGSSHITRKLPCAARGAGRFRRDRIPIARRTRNGDARRRHVVARASMLQQSMQ
ncbi:hypothetical protein EZV77_30945 [Burkholderia thailandensis]|nr:hypothetical protein EZV77_30945 [Burkholderia thailandensis]